jgi:uroporphyrinogen III methyltransferase/synthase
LDQFDWLVFTSVNGVHAFIHRLLSVGRDLRALGQVRIAAIGPGTAAALCDYYLEPDLVPAQYDSETLAAELRKSASGRRILLARADRGREVLREELAKIADVEPITVYSQTDAVDSTSPVLGRLRRGEMDAITLTSSNIARALHAGLDDATRERISRGEIALVSISRVTSAAIRELGWPVAAEATRATAAGVIDALVEQTRKRN